MAVHMVLYTVRSQNLWRSGASDRVRSSMEETGAEGVRAVFSNRFLTGFVLAQVRVARSVHRYRVGGLAVWLGCCIPPNFLFWHLPYRIYQPNQPNQPSIYLSLCRNGFIGLASVWLGWSLTLVLVCPRSLTGTVPLPGTLSTPATAARLSPNRPWIDLGS